MKDSVLDKLIGCDEAEFSVADSFDEPLSAADLINRVRVVASILTRSGCRGVALYADNGIDWIVSDLACQLAGVAIVPLPLFFSDEQLQFAIRSSGVDALLTDQVPRLSTLLTNIGCGDVLAAAGQMRLLALEADPQAQVPPATSKITFTSGTTGTPKGVCLSALQQRVVAESLVAAVGIERPRHLCLLPLSTLLENVAGVYAPLLAGGHVIAPSLIKLGLIGSSGLNTGRLLENISLYAPDSLILVPEMLRALTVAAANGWTPPESLKFVAVGGGKTAPGLIRSARDAGLPVYEGYGLSECSSVVSLNSRHNDRVGSAGRPLQHAGVEIDDGEIVVVGSTFLGYAGQPDSWNQHCVRTGDLGHIDVDGHLQIDGRKKNLLISSFGRNISPEWVESELLAGLLLQQAVIFGDAQPCCVALVSPRVVTTTDAQIDAWISEVNAGLPDYARIAVWHRLSHPLTSASGLMTENGRPKREQIAGQFQQILTDMFDQPQEILAV